MCVSESRRGEGKRGGSCLVAVFLMSVNPLLCVIYFCDTSYRRKSDSQILSVAVVLLAVRTMLQKPLISIM